MKKCAAVVTAIVLAALCLGCGGKASGPVSGGETSGGRKYAGLPLVKDGNASFTMFISGLGGIAGNISSFDYADNSFTREVVDTTGVKLEFISVTAGERMQRLNLLFAAGDYPDIINDRDLSYADMNYWAGEGIFQPLDGCHYMEYPNIARAFEEYPALNDKLRGGDGKLYATPRVDDAIWSTYSMGRSFYYMPWARDHRRKIPETLDEFTDYLRWIRDNDINGNGDKNDEIPMAFTDVYNAVTFFANSFMPFVRATDYFGLALYDEKVTEQYRLNEYREALKYLAMLYKEGLIKEDSFTMNGDQLKALTLSEPPVLGALLNGYVHNVAGQSDPRWVEYFAFPPLKGPAGRAWGSNRDPWGILKTGWFITGKCKDPELAVAMYDSLLTREIYLNGTAMKGLTWDDPDPGALGLDGKPALYKRILTDEAMPLNTMWYLLTPLIINKPLRYGQQTDGAAEMSRWLNSGDPALRDTVFKNSSYLLSSLISFSSAQARYEIPDSYFIPPVALNDADNKRVGDINAVLGPYKTQSAAEFITGIRDISSDAAWNAYLSDLDRMASPELVTIYQKYLK
jgi:putative aldouronate transport system substrate-binding protein